MLAMVRQRLQANKILGEAQRFWLALLTTNIVGGMVAKELGFIKYDLSAVEDWAVQFVEKRAKEIGMRKIKPQNVFHDFMGRLYPNTVVAPQSGQVTSPKLSPLARIDYKTNTLSVSISALTQEAHQCQVALSDLLQGMQSSIYTYKQTMDICVTEGLPHALFAPIVLQCAQYTFDPAQIGQVLPDVFPENVVSMRK